jgi:hypothetical protein
MLVPLTVAGRSVLEIRAPIEELLRPLRRVEHRVAESAGATRRASPDPAVGERAGGPDALPAGGRTGRRCPGSFMAQAIPDRQAIDPASRIGSLLARRSLEIAAGANAGAAPVVPSWRVVGGADVFLVDQIQQLAATFHQSLELTLLVGSRHLSFRLDDLPVEGDHPDVDRIGLVTIRKAEIELVFGNIDTEKLRKRLQFLHHLCPILVNASSHPGGSSDGSGSKMNDLRSRCPTVVKYLGTIDLQAVARYQMHLVADVRYGKDCSAMHSRP